MKSKAEQPNARVGTGVSPRAQIAIVATMLLVWIVAALDKLIVFLLVGPIRADLGVTDFQMSFLLGVAFALAFAIGGLPFGYLADRMQRRHQIFIALMAWSLFSMACGLVSGFVGLLVLRALVGFAEAAFPPARDSMVADAVSPSRLGLATAVMTSGGVIGGGLGLVMGGVLTNLAGSTPIVFGPLVIKPWQMVFLITGASGLVLLPLLLTIPEPRRAERAAPAGEVPAGFGTLLRQNWQFYGGVLLAMSVMSAVSNGVTAWSPAYLNREFGMSMMQAGLNLGVIQTISILASLALSGWGIDFFYRRGIGNIHLWWIVGAAAIGGPLGVLAYQLTDARSFLTTFALFNLINLGYSVAAAAVLQIRTPSQFRGRIAALYYMLINIVGFGAGPTLVAGIAEFLLRDAGSLGPAISALVAIGNSLAILLLVAPLWRAQDSYISAPS